MAFTGIIEDAIIRLDGTDELVGVGTITLPDIEHKTETVTGFGIIEHELPLKTQFAAMKLSIKFINRNKGIALDSDSINLVAKAEITKTNAETHAWDKEVATYSFKGKKVKTSGGEIGKATKNETEVELALTYFKEEIDGIVVTEIDVYNRKAIINGKDMYEGVRNSLA